MTGMDDVGRMTERVTIQAPTSTADGAGGAVQGWADLASTPTVYAAVKAGAGREVFADDRTGAQSSVQFTIRNRSDIDERNRLIWRGEAYNVREVRREGARPIFLRIIAERGVAT